MGLCHSAADDKHENRVDKVPTKSTKTKKQIKNNIKEDDVEVFAQIPNEKFNVLEEYPYGYGFGLG